MAAFNTAVSSAVLWVMSSPAVAQSSAILPALYYLQFGLAESVSLYRSQFLRQGCAFQQRYEAPAKMDCHFRSRLDRDWCVELV